MRKILTLGSIMAMVLTPTVVTAKPVLESAPTSDGASAPYLIASPFRKEISPSHERRQSLMTMLIMQMEINELAKESMESDDPMISEMAKKMYDSSSEMMDEVLTLIQRSPRSGQFSR